MTSLGRCVRTLSRKLFLLSEEEIIISGDKYELKIAVSNLPKISSCMIQTEYELKFPLAALEQRQVYRIII